MKTIIAILAAAAVLAAAAPAGARPIDAYGPIPSDAPTAVSPSSSGADTWIVIAAVALAFAAGAGAARLAPILRPRVGAS